MILALWLLVIVQLVIDLLASARLTVSFATYLLANIHVLVSMALLGVLLLALRRPRPGRPAGFQRTCLSLATAQLLALLASLLALPQPGTALLTATLDAGYVPAALATLLGALALIPLGDARGLEPAVRLRVMCVAVAAGAGTMLMLAAIGDRLPLQLALSVAAATWFAIVHRRAGTLLLARMRWWVGGWAALLAADGFSTIAAVTDTPATVAPALWLLHQTFWTFGLLHQRDATAFIPRPAVQVPGPSIWWLALRPVALLAAAAAAGAAAPGAPWLAALILAVLAAAEALRAVEHARRRAGRSGDAAGLLHDIIKHADIIRALCVLREDVRAYWAPHLDRQAEHLVALLTQYRTVVSGGTPGECQLESVDVGHVGEEVYHAALACCGDNSPRLRYVVAASGLFVCADAVLLQRTLANLVHNALVAAGPHGEVVLRIGRAEEGPDVVDIWVEDTGPGMPEHLRQEVFKPRRFFRPGGQGMGLAVVAQAMAAIGGTYGVMRTCNGRTRFWVRLQLIEMMNHAVETSRKTGCGRSPQNT
jgi:signal transduction histidine kinase